ncbi:MFS transporter [Nocardioides sp. URHA0020]|uniref:MFS transporter n=1 Tax=Nocardioides sp. URHA0020 TaxID=1380392 RepID=UPI000684132C|nr:MFS transporter [Nocardioides sp. URHA0020]
MATRSLLPIALGTALVLVTYVTPMATVPATAADLGAGPVARAWILSSMSVGLAAALLAAGVLGDASGRRRVYAAGLGAIGLGALACALAQEPVLFVAARVVEGVGGAAVLACGLAVLAHDYAPGPARVHATSIWAASVGLGITAGAVLAAALDIGSGWRETYAVVGVLALLLLLPSLRRIGESSAAEPQRIDVPGLLLLVAAMTLLVSALTQGRNGIDAPTVVLAVLAVVAAVGFGLVERRVLQPLVDPALLRAPRFRAATLGSLTVGLGIIGMSSFVPTVAQLGLGTDLWTASLLVVAWSGTSVVTSYLVRHLPHPLEGPRPVAALLVLVATGQLTGYGLDASSGVWRLAVPMFVAGLATGVLNAVLGREAVASVPPDRAAMGSGANNTARYLGAACGITLFVVVATHAGADLLAGWNVAVLVAAGLTLVGAAAIAWSGRGRA